MYCGAEVTESSTNKQHHLSISANQKKSDASLNKAAVNDTSKNKIPAVKQDINRLDINRLQVEKGSRHSDYGASNILVEYQTNFLFEETGRKDVADAAGTSKGSNNLYQRRAQAVAQIFACGGSRWWWRFVHG